MGFEIRSGKRPAAPPLTTLRLWHAHAPPRNPVKHWKSGRSAMELAKAWHLGSVPPEVQAVLDGSPFAGVRVDRGWAEVLTAVDSRRGERRNNDLVLEGILQGRPALIDVEGKADEPFDQRSLKQVGAASPGQRGRATSISRMLFEREPNDLAVCNLRYQLVVGVYCTLKRAVESAVENALFLVQVFENETCSQKKLDRNRHDLDAFTGAFAAPSLSTTLPVTELRSPSGPWRGGVRLFIGKAVCWQGKPRP